MEYSLQSKQVRQKGKETCLDKYGVEYSSQSEEVKQKIKVTCLENHGVECSLQSEEVKQKGKKTCLKKYGVEYAMQHPDIFEKCQKSAFKLKPYIFPSGKLVYVQGYEPFALDYLIYIDRIPEDDIIRNDKRVPEIWYTMENDNKKHRYYADIYVPPQNKIIEVKSNHTYKLPKVYEKMKACLEQGYNYEIWIFHQNGARLHVITCLDEVYNRLTQ